MAILSILEYPDPRLRKKALPVAKVDSSIQTLIDDMFETMYVSRGVGLAATQVDVQSRIVVIDISETKESPICLINPEIIAKEGIQFENEGCLSVPAFYDRVERALKVTVRALDKTGKSFELEAEDLLACCLQHEIDHLDGILFVDHLSRLKQDRARKKVEKYHREMAR